MEKANHSVRLMCEVLGVSRSAFYAWCEGLTHVASEEDNRLLVHIRGIHRQHKGRYGSPRVTEQLGKQGMVANRKRVARIMREQGLQGTPRRIFRGTTTDSAHEGPIAPNLLQRNFTVDAPKRVIVGDITYLPTERGWVYLAVLIDLFSRKIVGWAMDDTMETSLCLRALERTLAARGDMAGAIHHTDRGSQYAARRTGRRSSSPGCGRA
jgi:putative transposase